MQAGHIILLNGASSAGKSTLARALQAQLPRALLALVDRPLDGGRRRAAGRG